MTKGKVTYSTGNIFRKSILSSVIGALALGNSISEAATYTVTNTDDTGAGSLRQAIIDANTTPGIDQIVFESNLSGSTLTLESGLEISDDLNLGGLGSDLLTIENAVSSGPMINITVSGGGVSISGLSLVTTVNSPPGEPLVNITEVVEIDIDDVGFRNTAGITNLSAFETGSNVNITISNSLINGFTSSSYVGSDGSLSLYDSEISDTSASGYGGALSVSGSATVHLERVIARNNVVSGGPGGLIYIDGGTLTVASSEFYDNQAGWFGGAISASGIISITDSVFENNTAAPLGYGGAVSRGAFSSGDDHSLTIDSSYFVSNTADTGGAIDYSGANVQITNSVFEGNTATDSNSLYDGGAIQFVDSEGRSLDIINSTFSGNSSLSSNGGGIAVRTLGETLATTINLLNVTMFDNTAQGTNSIAVGGTGSYNFSIVNSLISSTVSEGVEHIQGAFDVDFSLISGANTAAAITELTASSNLISVPLSLESLADNGGTRIGISSDIPLYSHAMAFDSAIVNAGDPTASTSPLSLPATDQRGEGFERIAGSGMEMGAVEYNNVAPVLDEAIPDVYVNVANAVSVNLSSYFSDLENDTLSFLASNLPLGLSVSTEGQLTGTIAIEAIENLPLTTDLVVSDGTQEVEATFNLVLENLSPEIIGELPRLSVNAGEDSLYDISGFFEDPERQALTYSLESAPTGLSISEQGVFTINSNSFFGAALPTSIALIVSDNEIATTFNLPWDNLSPEQTSELPSLSIESGENSQFDISNYFGDPEQEALSFSLESPPAGITISEQGILTIDAAQITANELPESVTVVVGDGTSTSSFTFAWNNLAPESNVELPSLSINSGENSQLDISSYFRDPEKHTLSFSLDSPPPGVTISEQGVITIDADQIAANELPESVTIVVGDGVSTASFVLAWDNLAPVSNGELPSLSVESGENSQFDISSYFSDPEQQALSFSLDSAPAGVTISAQGLITIDADQITANELPESVTIVVGDGVSTAPFVLAWDNLAPTSIGELPSLSIDLGESSQLDISTYFEDSEQRALRFSLDSPPTGITISEEGIITIDSAQVRANNLPESVTVIVDDGVSTASFILPWSNLPPELISELPSLSIIVGEASEFDISGAFEDPEQRSLSFSLASPPIGVSISEQGIFSINVTEIEAAELPESLTLLVSDGENETEHLISLNINTPADEADSTNSSSGGGSGGGSFDMFFLGILSLLFFRKRL